MASNTHLVRLLQSSISTSRTLLLNHNSKSRLAAWCNSRHASTKPTDQPSEADSEPQAESKENVVSPVEEQLQADVKKLGDELKEQKEKYMRSLAETENMRKRLMKQTDDAKVFGIQSFCKDLLEVSDVLRLAITTVPKEELTDSNPHLTNLFQGLNMTESQLLKVFQKHGLNSISPAEGEKFNPHIHEAMFQVPVMNSDVQQADTVAVVQKIGFKLHERTLRPAQVGVFKGS